MVFPNWWSGYRSITEGKTMDTKRNTAAIHVRRSAADRRDVDESDNRSHARQGRDCQALAECCGVSNYFHSQSSQDASPFASTSHS